MENIHHNSNENRSINDKINHNSTDMNDLCNDSSQIENGDKNEQINQNEIESSISSSSLITATVENDADIECPEMPSLIISITSKDITKIVLEGSSNCRTFDMNMLTNHYHDTYNAIPFEKKSQEDHDYQENSNGHFHSVGSQGNLLATSVGDLIDALSPIILLASDNLDNHKSILENQYLNDNEKINSNTNNSPHVRVSTLNKKIDYTHSMTDSALYSLITSPLLIECSCGEHDMRYTSLKAAEQLGISAVTIDIRILFKNYSHNLHPNSNPPKKIFNNLPFKYQKSDQPGMSMNTNGEFLIKNYSPCILLIENMDSFVYGDDDKEITNEND
eukprot:CAMPEP_0119046880 /NCGR_PEP_ID=MMETSP1177-20130426/49452_1 /TAXON_ID=2985 /ORGANISM="Ochromonas sp, Strain CCMP1899" /LENGTH=332 /DNA_ID=CAMNT_0007020629 /DNA_START=772 /DNA_END=1767 /DNA_ORIENTATION=-